MTEAQAFCTLNISSNDSNLSQRNAVSRELRAVDPS